MADNNLLEIEVKIPIDDFEKTFKCLENEGFIHTAVHEETDTYFNSVHYNLNDYDKALRIRRVVDKTNGKSWAEFNCKGPKLDGVSVSRRETETRVENPDAIEGILAELEFFPVECIVKKTRYYFTKDNITAVLDRVEDLGDFLELEILEYGEEKRAACLKKIEEVMKNIGYKMEDAVRTSYLSMLQNKS